MIDFLMRSAKCGKVTHAEKCFPNAFVVPHSKKYLLLQRINAAIANTLNRVDIHHFRKDGKRTSYDFFHHLNERAGGGALLSGGMPRELVGFLHRGVLREVKRQSGSEVALEVLQRLAEERIENRLSPLDVLGIGSDMDVTLLDPPDEAFASIQTLIESANTCDVLPQLHRTADIQMGNCHWEKSIAQGGSSLDWLRYSLRHSQVICPDAFPSIMELLVNGQVEFVAPKEGTMSDATTARAIRTCIQFPHLKPTEASRSILIQAIHKLTQRAQDLAIKNPQIIIDQVRKGIRNARSPEICNYFAVPGPHQDDVARAIYTFSKINGSLIHEFLSTTDIHSRAPDFDPGDLRKNGKLLSPQDLRSLTDGKLYHGTHEDNLLPIMGTGPIISSSQQGTARYGQGFYTSWNISVAKGYAQSAGKGSVLLFHLLSSPNLRVIDAQCIPQEISKEAPPSPGGDINQTLAQKYAVDIIIFREHQYALVQNRAALYFPESMQEWHEALLAPLEALIDSVDQSESKTEEIFNVLSQHPHLYCFASFHVQDKLKVIVKKRIDCINAMIDCGCGYDLDRNLLQLVKQRIDKIHSILSWISKEDIQHMVMESLEQTLMSCVYRSTSFIRNWVLLSELWRVCDKPQIQKAYNACIMSIFQESQQGGKISAFMIADINKMARKKMPLTQETGVFVCKILAQLCDIAGVSFIAEILGHTYELSKYDSSLQESMDRAIHRLLARATPQLVREPNFQRQCLGGILQQDRLVPAFQQFANRLLQISQDPSQTFEIRAGALACLGKQPNLFPEDIFL